MTMIPGQYNFQVFPGADIDFSVTVSGKDLTGYTARASMRPSWPSSFVFPLEVSIAAAAPNWKISLFAPGASTTGMERARGGSQADSSAYFWDLELVAPDGKISRLLQGSNEVLPEATR